MTSTILGIILSAYFVSLLLGLGVVMWDYLQNNISGMKAWGLTFVALIPVVNVIWVAGYIIGKIIDLISPHKRAIKNVVSEGVETMHTKVDDYLESLEDEWRK